MIFSEYIRNCKPLDGFADSGLDKNIYLDIMDITFDAYSVEEIAGMTKRFSSEMIDDIHSFSRLTAALGELIANGRRTEHMDLWISMMDCCCRDIPRITGNMKLDFAMKEIMPVIKAMTPFVSEEIKSRWLSDLAKTDPYVNYMSNLNNFTPDKLHNINVFNMVGEYLRQSEGITDTTEYFRRHWPVQLSKFDINGMYKDPENPILYDVASRFSIQLMLFYGYNGEFFKQLDDNLQKAALYSLFMQSSNFELPYGGRSNQFLFGEAYVAGVCEYEACRFKSKGDLKTAGMLKRCARLTMNSVLKLLKESTPPKHNRNFYPIDTHHGEECYAYYDKYMITLAVNAYQAYLYADDSIEEYPCPQEYGGYVFETSEDFNKIFACCKGNFIEVDTCANPHYDSTGLGRYHKSGIPSELALSMPFAKNPEYAVSSGLDTACVSICAGWDAGEGTVQYLSEISQNTEHTTEIVACTETMVSFTVTYSGSAFKGCDGIKEKYTLNEKGVAVEYEAVNPLSNVLYCTVPLLVSNGRDTTKIRVFENSARVELENFVYDITASGDICVSEKSIANKNGEYKIAHIKSDKGKLCINLKLDKLF